MKFHSKKIRLSGKPAILLTIAIATANLYAFPDFEEAKSSADAGEADAQAIAATYYALGWQTEKNPEAAIQYAEQSSRSGNPLGKFRLGAMMRNGEGIPKDEPRGLSLQAEAVKIWSQDFDEEDPFSLTALGVALFQGKVLPQDKVMAAKYYKKAADLDFAPAQYNYAMCAKLGEGIPKDSSLSQKYLQKAAQNGYRLAQEALGMAADASPSEDQSDSPSIAQTGSLGGALNLAGAAPDAPASAPASQTTAGPLSGSFSLGGTPSQPASPATSADNSTKLITVTGLGLTPESAEKQAITDAVKQAVGAYIDANTLVQNEEVVRDRILSVSNGFVKEYKPAAPAKKREDGLYEITIIATVETNQIVQKLKESNLIKGEVAGQNLWAEASTKVMNAQDAVTMLQAKFPELLKSCLTITPVDAKLMPKVSKDSSGNLVPSTEPVDVSKNVETGEATLTWLFEIGIDKKYYRETLVPLVDQCLQAITESTPKQARMNWKKAHETIYNDTLYAKEYSRFHFYESIFKDNVLKADFPNANFDEWPSFPILIKSFSKNLDSCDYIWYQNPKNDLHGIFKNQNNQEGAAPTVLSLELLDSNAELIAFSKSTTWQPFSFREGLQIIGPYINQNGQFQPKNITLIQINLPIDSLKDISKVNVTLEVNEPVFTLKSVNN
jgi:hypothetical protein